MPSSPLRPIWWDGDAVMILDQRLLPHKHKVLRCTTVDEVIRAIKTMAIRGAPAVGIAGAMAAALAARAITAADVRTFFRKFSHACQRIRAARPTGNNLTWAVDAVFAVMVENPGADVPTLQQLIREKSQAILEEDIRTNEAIGQWGRQVVPRGARILTYCNAGALATGDYGTALGVIRAAFAADPSIHVTCCETRPFLQGSRLTAYELMTEKIPCTLITDNAAGSLMQQKKIDLVIVGADRIAANGDTANKIGTYTLAVLAQANGVPFYVAAPRSTIDPLLPNGSGIPIEERDPKEVTHFYGRQVAPRGMAALNPAFDVTPHRYISGIITEVGVIGKPFTRGIRRALEAPAPGR